MGIDIESKLMLVPKGVDVYDYLTTTYPDTNYYGEILDNLGLDHSSPHYDSDPEYWIVGISMSCPSYEDLLDQESKWWDDLNAGKGKLDEVFGLCDAKLEDVPNVW